MTLPNTDHKPMIIAQFSDSHLRPDGKLYKKTVDTEVALNACIEHLNSLDPLPDLALATGDLVQKADARSYRLLRTMLDRLKMPVYVIPGNHDGRDRMREAFADAGYLPKKGFLHYVIEDRPLRLIGLDTHIPGEDGGELCPERLRWLEKRLTEDQRPTALFMHHPPFATGMPYMDKHGFGGSNELEKLIARHVHVEWIMCGHLHRPITLRWAGTTASTAPSVTFQMHLNLRLGAPSGFVTEPPGCPLYVWSPDKRLIAHMTMIGDFGPRHAFHPELEK